MLNKIEIIKISLLGNFGVGKRSIISRYKADSFREKNLQIGDKTVQLDLWDTASQEKYHSISHIFYKSAYVVCLVYDITNQKSLEDLKEIWYPDLKNYGEKYTVLAVVGNKSDLYEKEEVKEEEARAFAKEIGAIFMLTSAKNGDNIKHLFYILAENYLSQKFKSQVKGVKNERTGSFRLGIDKNDNYYKKKCC